MSRASELGQLLRSMLAGAAATAVDLGTMAIMVSLLGVPVRVASAPALVLAGSVGFVGNRRFAFRSEGKDPRRQAVLYVLVHLVTLGLNAVAFDGAMRLLGAVFPYWALRLVVSNAVYLAWSFPMFRRIFGGQGACANAVKLTVDPR